MTRDEAEALDAADPLAFARTRFRRPPDLIYLDGNSLGMLPAAAPAALAATSEREWGEDLISSWNKNGWIDWPVSLAAKLAPIVGARPNELLIADSTSVCLYKLLAAAARARPQRRVILSERENFPTDLYVAQGLCDMLGLTLRTVERSQICASIDQSTAVVLVTHVDYRTASLHDMAKINELAEAKGALAIWDLSHSAGALAIDLNGSGATLAVGCGYKYLNGGPGAPAFIYVAAELQPSLSNPVQGWMGHSDPFIFSETYRPSKRIDRFLTGTPSILALAALGAGISTFDEIAMSMVEGKSRRLSQLFIDEVATRCGAELQLASPRDPSKRGSHVVFAHPNGYAVMQALIARSVVGDFRSPDLIRFGFAPLYNSYSEIVRAAEILGSVIQSREWDQPRFKTRSKVT